MLSKRFQAASVYALTWALLALPACGKDAATKRQPTAAKPRADGTAETPASALATTPHSSASPLANAATAAKLLRERPRTAWYGVYLSNKKIGYAHIQARTARPGEPGGFAVALSFTVMVQGFGSDKIIMDETRFFAPAPPHQLLAIHSSETSTKGKRRITFVANAGQLTVNQTADGAKKPQRTIAGTKETLAGSLSFIGADTARLTTGLAATIRSFDTDKELDDTEQLTVVSVDTRILGGVRTKVAVVSIRTEGENTAGMLTIAGRGAVLDVSIGAGLRMKLEDQTVATKDVVGFGVISDAIKVDRALGDTSQRTKLHLIVGVAKGFTLPHLPNQKVTGRADGRFDVRLTSGPAEAVTANARAAALRVTGAIDHTSPTIRTLAAKLTAGTTAKRDKVSRLNQWIYKTLRKDLATNLSTASQVLAHKVGDCTEHSILLVALARASGIPAREVSGLIYMGDEFQAFGYHAWVEVALGGRWVPVDPSWGEDIASAAHVRLGAGTSSDWVGTMGAITVSAPR